MTQAFVGAELTGVEIMLTRVLGDVMRHGVANQLQYDAENKRFVFNIEGFYKHGAIKMWAEGFTIMVKDRYNPPFEVKDAEELADFNYREWRAYRERNPGWNDPDPSWVPILKKYGLIKERKVTSTTYIGIG